jgi:hypothetical protein
MIIINKMKFILFEKSLKKNNINKIFLTLELFTFKFNSIQFNLYLYLFVILNIFIITLFSSIISYIKMIVNNFC